MSLLFAVDFQKRSAIPDFASRVRGQRDRGSSGFGLLRPRDPIPLPQRLRFLCAAKGTRAKWPAKRADVGPGWYSNRWSDWRPGNLILFYCETLNVGGRVVSLPLNVPLGDRTNCFCTCTTIPTLLFHAPRSALRTLWREQHPLVPASAQSSVKGILQIPRKPNCFEVGVPVRLQTIGNRILHDQISEQVDPFHFHLVKRGHQQARQAAENANRTYRD